MKLSEVFVCLRRRGRFLRGAKAISGVRDWCGGRQRGKCSGKGYLRSVKASQSGSRR